MKNKQKYLITSALLYSNGSLHFGHLAGAYLPADCFARAMRLEHEDVLFISGSDEFGIAITLSAELAGRTPKDHVDHFHEINVKLFEKMNFSFDHYSRTTWDGHIEPTQKFFLELLDNGYIEEKVTDQLYSAEDNKFLADRYVVGTCPRCKAENARGDECPSCGASYEATDLISPRSKMTGASLELKPTKNWFLRFDKFKDRLLTWLDEKKWKPNVVNFVKHYIENLKPRAITRDSDWGIKIPLEDTDGKVLYVWFDAPIGYISASKEWALKNEDPKAWEKYWLDPETKLINFIGKDNIPFHAIFFPAMCMGQNEPFKLVDELPANEFLNLEGKQFSKSSGWYIDLKEFLEEFSEDQIRYYLAANAPETSDSEFTWKDFQQRNNSELVAKFGNFVNRTLVFNKKQNGLSVPPRGDLEKIDEEFLENCRKISTSCREAYKQFQLRKASQLVIELSQIGNVYFDAKSPWVDAKDPKHRTRMLTTVYCCLECIKYLSVLSYPIIPRSAEKLFAMLGFKETLLSHGFDGLKLSLDEGKELLPPEILFQKIEDETITKHLDELYQAQ